MVFLVLSSVVFAAGGDPVFWFAIQGEGVNLMVNPDRAIGSLDLEIEVKVAQATMPPFYVVEPAGGFEDWFYVWSVQDGLIKIVATGATPLVEPAIFFKLNIKHYCGPVDIVFKKVLINGWPEPEGANLLVLGGKTEGIVFEIIPEIGDINADGMISSQDAVMILLHVLGTEELTSEEWVRADVTGLGGVTTRDAMLILQYSAGIIFEFPTYDGKGAPAKNPLSFEELVDDLLASEQIEEDVLNLLTDAHDSERSQQNRLPITWGGIKKR